MKLSAIITATFDGTTLGELEQWVKDIRGFEAGTEESLLDGAQIHMEGDKSDSLAAWGRREARILDLDAVDAWVQDRYGDYDESSVLEEAQDLCFDLAVVDVEEIDCSECPSVENRVDVLVSTHHCVRFN